MAEVHFGLGRVQIARGNGAVFKESCIPRAAKCREFVVELLRPGAHRRLKVRHVINRRVISRHVINRRVISRHVIKFVSHVIKFLVIVVVGQVFVNSPSRVRGGTASVSQIS